MQTEQPRLTESEQAAQRRSDVPDPMPEELRDTPEVDAAFEEAASMEGDAPSG